MSLAILGVGTSVPPTAVSQGRAAELSSLIAGQTVEQAERLAILYGLTGIARRHLAILDEGGVVPGVVGDSPAGPMTAWRMNRYASCVGPIARQASSAAIDRAGFARDAITHLVTVSCTGFSAPGFDIDLIQSLGLSPAVQRTHVGFMGCHGALNGLRVARGLMAAEPEGRVLVCAAELCSLHFSYGGNGDRTVPNALFADGAAAIVAGPGDGHSSATWRCVANGSVLVPGTEEAMTWSIGDHGFEMHLSAEVPSLIREHLSPWLNTWLARQGLETARVASWAVHPGGPRILDAVARALRIDGKLLDDSRAVMLNHGNMSSATLLFILDRLIEQNAPRPCIALAFGPGLAVEAALFA
jgi:predicted naringenin-chalcone synthase